MDRTEVSRASAVLGGALVVGGGVAALLTGGADTVVVGGFATVGGGLAAIAGAVVARTNAGLTALLLIATAVVVGMVAPGVIPAIADSIVVFFGYLAGATLIAVAAVVAILNRAGTGATATS